MTTEEQLLSAVRALRAENLDALGRHAEAEALRVRSIEGLDKSPSDARPAHERVPFSEPAPDLESTAGYRGSTAAKAAGISYRQLDYWARTQLVEPTVSGSPGSGSQRLYGVREILILKLVKRLLDTGLSLRSIRVAVERLRSSGLHDLAQTTLMSDGDSVYFCRSDDEVIDLVSQGQAVYGIAVGKVLREVESALMELDGDSTAVNDARDDTGNQPRKLA